MRKIIASTFISLDGIMSRYDDNMDWVVDNFSEQLGEEITRQQNETDTMLIGEKSYHILSSFWPHATTEMEDQATIDHMNNTKKIVFSSTLVDPTWNNTEVKRSIDKEEILELKKQDGKSMTIIGSASIVQQLTSLGLIDEYWLYVHPVILGEGKRLFDNIEGEHKLELFRTRQLDSGVVVLNYRTK